MATDDDTAAHVPSREALKAILEEGGPVAKAIRAKVGRSLISRYLSGGRIPGDETRPWLAAVSGGRVSDAGWFSPEELRERARSLAEAAAVAASATAAA